MLSNELKSQVQYVDVLVVGAGPAGMAAAIAAREAGIQNLLVLEREDNMLKNIDSDSYDQILFCYSVDNFIHDDVCSRASLLGVDAV